MRKIIALFIVATVSTFFIGHARADHQLEDAFQMFPAPIYTGEIAPLQWEEGKTPWVADYLASRILHSAGFDYEEMANDLRYRFGGHYILVTAGCGTYCQSGVIIDLKTGIPYELPVSRVGLWWRADSNLLIINPLEEETPRDLILLDSTTYVELSGIMLGVVPAWNLIEEAVWPEDNR